MQSKLQIHRDKELPRQNLLLTALGNGIIDRCLLEILIISFSKRKRGMSCFFIHELMENTRNLSCPPWAETKASLNHRSQGPAKILSTLVDSAKMNWGETAHLFVSTGQAICFFELLFWPKFQPSTSLQSVPVFCILQWIEYFSWTLYRSGEDHSWRSN